MTDGSRFSRREVVLTSATVLGGAALLTGSKSAHAAPTRRWEASYSGGPVSSKPESPGEAGRDYQPTTTPGGTTLPFRVVDGVKVYHLVAEEVDPDRVFLVERKDVDNAAANGILAACFDDRFAASIGYRVSLIDLVMTTTRGIVADGLLLDPRGFAAINDDFNVSPQKAIYRMLTWESGTFELEPGGEMNVMEEIQESTEGLLMEGVRQIDEFRNMAKELPSPHSALAVPTPVAGKLRDLSHGELDIFQLVLDHGQLQAILDNYWGSDLDAAKNLIALMKREFVVVP